MLATLQSSLCIAWFILCKLLYFKLLGNNILKVSKSSNQGITHDTPLQVYSSLFPHIFLNYFLFILSFIFVIRWVIPSAGLNTYFSVFCKGFL